jgi:flagellar hook-basal body complex protein FliE
MDLISTLAARGYDAARSIAQPEPQGPSAVERAAADFAQTLARSEETSKAALTGGADATALVQALAQTEIAVEAAVAVRDRVVEAYQEILRMPV